MLRNSRLRPLGGAGEGPEEGKGGGGQGGAGASGEDHLGGRVEKAMR